MEECDSTTGVMATLMYRNPPSAMHDRKQQQKMV
jgi:hypothetical protein